jgi:hypothetical protein
MHCFPQSGDPRAEAHVCFAAVKQAGGEVLPGACGLRLHGWRIESRKAPISSMSLRVVMHLVCRPGVLRSACLLMSVAHRVTSVYQPTVALYCVSARPIVCGRASLSSGSTYAAAVQCVHGAEDAEVDKLKAELRHALSVPEQLFGDSFLRLTHEPSGTVLEFTALDALRCASLTGRRPRLTLEPSGAVLGSCTGCKPACSPSW